MVLTSAIQVGIWLTRALVILQNLADNGRREIDIHYSEKERDGVSNLPDTSVGWCKREVTPVR